MTAAAAWISADRRMVEVEVIVMKMHGRLTRRSPAEGRPGRFKCGSVSINPGPRTT